MSKQLLTTFDALYQRKIGARYPVNGGKVTRFIGRMMPKDTHRFWSRVDIRGDDECWLWTRPPTNNGYAVFSANYQSAYAHRVAYQLGRGRIVPSFLVVDHRCGNRLCMNPYHLKAVKERVNILRGNGACAVNSRKTHCPQGHEYSESNIKWKTKQGRQYRQCKPCLDAQNATYLERMRARH